MTDVDSAAYPYEIETTAIADGGGPEDSESNDRTIPDLSPREARNRWLNHIRSSVSEATVSTYHYQLKLFVEWCEDNGIDSIREVSGWELSTYENHRREADVKTITLRKELGTLKNFLAYCARIEIVDEALPKKVDPPDTSADDEVSEKRLRPDRAETLLEYYDEHDYGSRSHALLALLWFTGARLGAIRGLDLDNYESAAARVQFFHRPAEDTPLKKKHEDERAVGLPQEVCDILDEYIAHYRHDVYDEYGRSPLIASEVGRPSPNSIRAWTNLATVPCLHSMCPHGYERETCEFVDYAEASKCPSSRSPHDVRTGSITWQLNRGIPKEAVAERVNSSVRNLEKHYDKPSKVEGLEERRRQHVHCLSFDGDEEGEE